MGYDKEIRIGGTRKTTIGQKVLVRLVQDIRFAFMLSFTSINIAQSILIFVYLPNDKELALGH